MWIEFFFLTPLIANALQNRRRIMLRTSPTIKTGSGGWQSSHMRKDRVWKVAKISSKMSPVKMTCRKMSLLDLERQDNI